MKWQLVTVSLTAFPSARGAPLDCLFSSFILHSTVRWSGPWSRIASRQGASASS